MKDRLAKYHQGITMHALRVGGCVAGAIFAIGVMAIVLAGVPIAGWFLLASMAGGIAAFLLIRSFRSSN
ncbi:MAG: hypothetical protein L0099_01995 [Acidobacteria bacterium]|nr:hypothetical protein [Acidobacteriota bacterium]